MYINHAIQSWKYDVNISRIESRPVSNENNGRSKFDFFVDFHGKVGDVNVNALLHKLKGMTDKLLVLDEKEVRILFAACGIAIQYKLQEIKRIQTLIQLQNYPPLYRCTGSHATSPNSTSSPTGHSMQGRI